MDGNLNAKCSVAPSLHGRAVLRLHNLALTPLNIAVRLGGKTGR